MVMIVAAIANPGIAVSGVAVVLFKSPLPDLLLGWWWRALRSRVDGESWSKRAMRIVGPVQLRRGKNLHCLSADYPLGRAFTSGRLCIGAGPWRRSERVVWWWNANRWPRHRRTSRTGLPYHHALYRHLPTRRRCEGL